MQKLKIPATAVCPEIYFSPDENIFRIKGNSAPEDVRALYYPVIDWIKGFVDENISGGSSPYNENNPILFSTDLEYFNSSSAKFLFDIFTELKRLAENNVPVRIEWFYEEEDLDMKEAGEDIAELADMQFIYTCKKQ